jgi:hypothetical protein|nr:MAG TPA_asm: Protein of unknown function (DUF2634) [Caudoviricetes sp.]
MFPENFVENDNIEDTEEVGTDFLFDYKTGQHILNNGILKECSEVGSIKQYIQNVLRTQANIYDIYLTGENDIFGISIYRYLGTRTLPMGYLNSELKREVIQQLLKHPKISSVTGWQGKRERQGLTISFTVILKDGTILEESDFNV